MSTIPKQVRENSRTEPRLGIGISNEGLGPATIKQFAVFISGRQVGIGEAGLKKALADLGLNDVRVRLFWFEEGAIIPQGMREMIVSVETAEATPMMIQSLRNAADSLGVFVEYKSIMESYSMLLLGPTTLGSQNCLLLKNDCELYRIGHDSI